MTPEKKRPSKPLRRFDAEASAALASAVLAQAKVPGAVIGTINANSYLSEDNELETRDLDLAVKQEDVIWIEKVLGQRGVPFEQLDIGGVRVRIDSDAIHLAFVDRHTVQQIEGVFREALEATNESLSIGKVELQAAPIEHVIAMKLATARPKDDLIIQALLQVEDVDWKRALNIVSRHYGAVGANRLRALAVSAGVRR